MKITNQHTYVFSETGESVTVYQSDTMDGFAIALSLDHTETEESLAKKWSKHYQGIHQIQSKVTPLVWYMYLNQYWEGHNHIPCERVMMVSDCNYPIKG